MHKNSFRGFTLIELLVVIAIIGILSAVVLASLNTARSRGTDAAIQSNLDSIRVQAELVYNNTNSYGTVYVNSGSCAATANTLFADTTIQRAIVATEAINGSGSNVCNSTATSYAIASPIVAVTGYWCIDSTGFSG